MLEKTTPFREGKILDKNINVLICKINAKKIEKEALVRIVDNKWELIDIDARNSFYGGVGGSTIKYLLEYNYHKVRNKEINNNLHTN